MKLAMGLWLILVSTWSFSASAETFEVTLSGTVVAIDTSVNDISVGDEYLESMQFEADSGEDWLEQASNIDGTTFTLVSGSLRVGQLVLPWIPNDPHQGAMVFINKYENENGNQQRISSHYKYGPYTRLIDQKLQGEPLPLSNEPTSVLNANDLLALNLAALDNNSNSNKLYIGSSVKVRFTIDSISINSLNSPSPIPMIYYSQTGISDINNNGYPEFATLRTTSSSTVNVVFVDAISRDYIKSVSYLSSNFVPLSITTIPDGNGNNYDEIVVMGRNKQDGKIRTVIKDSHTDETLNSFNWTP